ncbi:MAG: helix-turn-helix domain-containing protein [Spirochaetaceae bacterium]|jgi:transposase|nr:helix-turn-helix domain-containing protein [Spirochaetaceae bacterium]
MKLPMGQKELIRGKVMEMVKRGHKTIAEAAQALRVSYRQGRRIYAAYEREGTAGLSTGIRGSRRTGRRRRGCGNGR